MAPLAAWMARSGYPVCGYDDDLKEPVRRFLENEGVPVRDFLFAEEVGSFATVVFSSAVGPGHPLLRAAREAGARCLRRGEMLAEMARGRRLIAVAGSHGKTTTTGMILSAVRHSGVGANVIPGGLFGDPSVSAVQCSESDWLVAEIDESDGTIKSFAPEISVILNLDWDHADFYDTAEALEDAFEELAARTSGQVLVPFGPGCGGLRERFRKNSRAEVLSFGAGGDFDLRETPDGPRLGGRFPEMRLGDVPAGAFNRTNGAAALAVLHLLGAPIGADALSGFGGMARRQQVLRWHPEVSVVADYAHHPTEIRALLGWLRTMAPERRLTVVFQPHRYSRTRQFKEAFADVLGGADELFLLPVYPAHESEAEGGRTEDLVAAFPGEAPEVLESGPRGLRRLGAAAGGGPRTFAFVGAGDIEGFAAAFAALADSGFDEAEAWERFLRPRVSAECVLRRDESLAAKTTMRVGGAARFYAEPANLTDLRALLGAARLFGAPVFCLGRGSNLVVADEGFDGLVVRFSGGAWRQVTALPGDRLWASAGVRLKEICGYAARRGLCGFEFLEGIPGSVGGALRMNAGAMGSWVFDVVERVRFLDTEGRLRDLPAEAFHFGYRRVEELDAGIALGAVLRSAETTEEPDIRRRMDSYATIRKSSQPRGPSAGCIFKNPEGEYAGRLIDQCGLKGLSVGGASVSEVHGNFIVNRGGASASDVIALVRRVRNEIRARRGVELEPEVLLLGSSWAELLREDENAAAEGGGHG